MSSISGTSELTIPIIELSGSGITTIVINNQDIIDIQEISEPYIDDWAYDLSKNTQSVGEALNEKAINISIENILSTSIGERLFAPFFGSRLSLELFEQMNITYAEQLLDDLLESISLWEDRITIVRTQIEMNVLTEQNAMTLVLPYIINKNGLTGTFSRKIVL